MDLTFFLIEDSFISSILQESEELFLTHTILRSRRESEKSQYQSCRRREKPDERIGDHHKIPKNRYTEESNPLRMIHGDRLRDELSDHDRDISDHRDGDHESDERSIHCLDSWDHIDEWSETCSDC